MARWRGQRLLGAAVIGLLGYGVFTAVVGGSTVSGSLRMRVRGVVVDTETGAPIEGVTLLLLRDTASLRGAEDLERYGRPVPARTDAAGAFDIVVGIRVSYRTGWSGSVSGRSRESPFDAAQTLLVEKEGYFPLVHKTKDAHWLEQREGGIVGTLEVGTIRLTRVR